MSKILIKNHLACHPYTDSQANRRSTAGCRSAWAGPGISGNLPTSPENTVGLSENSLVRAVCAGFGLCRAPDGLPERGRPGKFLELENWNIQTNFLLQNFRINL